MASPVSGLRAAFPARPGLLRHLVAVLRHRLEMRAAARRLAAMDDHMLRDLGITRADIAAMRRGRR